MSRSNWKEYEKRICERLGYLFFGVTKPKGARIDRDCPLCRAAASGAHQSCIRPGDVVPNGLWIREGRLTHLEDFPFVIEVKDTKDSFKPEALLTAKKSGFFSQWDQTVRQAKDFKETAIPTLVINKPATTHDFVAVDHALFHLYGRDTVMPKNRLYLTVEREFSKENISIFLLGDFIEANEFHPFKYMVRSSDGK